MLRLNSHFQKLEKTSQARHSGTTFLLVSGVRVFHEDYLPLRRFLNREGKKSPGNGLSDFGEKISIGC